jgi:hypothetical protein
MVREFNPADALSPNAARAHLYLCGLLDEASSGLTADQRAAFRREPVVGRLSIATRLGRLNIHESKEKN